MMLKPGCRYTVSALTSEATLRGILKRKFGEGSVSRAYKHTVPALTSEVTLRGILKRKFGEGSVQTCLITRSTHFVATSLCQGAAGANATASTPKNCRRMNSPLPASCYTISLTGNGGFNRRRFTSGAPTISHSPSAIIRRCGYNLSSTTRWRSFLSLFFILALACSLKAQDAIEQVIETSPSSTPSLLNRNPFLPADHRATPTPSRPTPPATNAAERDLEVRAFYEFAGTFYVSVFNRQSQKSTWLSPGETRNGIQLRRFNPENRVASIQFGGSSAEMRLREPDEKPLPVTRDAPPAASGSGQPPVVPAVDENGTSEPPRPTVPRRRVILPQAPVES
jgi:hypothetical protein